MPSIYALKRKHKKLQEEYDLKSEELHRLRKAHTIETDPSQKFKFEKQIEQLDQKRKQLKQELEKLEYLFDHPEEIPPFQWDYSKFPINVSSKIEFLTQYFVGRQEAVERIEKFLQTHKSGYLAIVGEAGIGKSALLAHEVKKRGAVHHFVDDKQNSAKDEVFLRCIVEQLRQKYGFEFEERTPISVSEWNIYFQKWMKEFSTGESLVIFVDALDEAQLYGGSDNLLKYLPDEVPDNVYFILTSRPEFKKEDITFSASTVFERYGLPPLTQVDIEAYLAQRSIPPFVKGDEGGLSEIAAIFYQKSEGNPLYLYYLMQEREGENLTLEQVNQLPQGLMKFYEKQWRERIWIGGKATKEGHKQILCLLLILKEPPSKEMLLALIDFDWAELQEYLTPLRGFIHSGERYEIFHDSFKNFISDQFEKTIPAYHEQLIEKLWNWQELKDKLARYAFLWLPTHLLEAKQYEKLFALARETAFRQTQSQIFPDEPNLPLRILQTALQGAADTDNAARMSEFLLAHAQYVVELLQENPIEALRKGNLPRAWGLADFHEIERCTKWYLLLAWMLKNMNRLQDAQATLQRLLKKDIPKTLNTPDDAFLLVQVSDINKNAVIELCKRTINSSIMYLWMSEFFIIQGRFEAFVEITHLLQFDVACEIIQRFQSDPTQAKRLYNLAIAYIRFGDVVFGQTIISALTEKVIWARQLQDRIQLPSADYEDWMEALQSIAIAQVWSGDTPGALKLLQNIDHYYWAEVLKAIADVQSQERDIAKTLEIIQCLKNKSDQEDVLRLIVVAQAKAGEFLEAIKTALCIKDKWAQIHAFQTVTQVEMGDAIEAIKTARRIRNESMRTDTLREIAEIKVMIRKNFETVQRIRRAASPRRFAKINEYRWAHTLRGIAEIQVIIGENFETVIDYFPQASSLLVFVLRIAHLLFPAVNLIKYFYYSGYEEEWVSLLCKRVVLQAKTGNLKNAKEPLTIALKTAQRIKDKEFQSGALQEIAIAQVQTGDVIGAIKTAQSIKEEWDRGASLKAIATVQAQRGDIIGAIKTAQSIKEEWGRVASLKAIAVVQAQTGDSIGTIKTVKLIKSEQDRSEVLREIATAQTRMGDITGACTILGAAIEIAQCIRSESDQEDILQVIAMAQVQAGEYFAAIKTARAIWDEKKMADTLREIGVAQAQSGHFAAAIDTARYISFWSESAREDLLRAIATAQVQAGEYSAAIKTIQRIWGKRKLVDALREIGVAQAQSGKFAVAIKTVQGIWNKRKRVDALREIAAAQARAGDVTGAHATFAEAIKMVQGIWNKRKRADVLREIAAAQARTGDVTGAHSTFAEAIKTAQGIQSVWTWINWLTWGLWERVWEQINWQNWDLLARIIDTLRSQCESKQEEILQTIAVTQVQIEDSMAALKTVQHIKDKWTQIITLQDIAVGQAQARDIIGAHTTFTRLFRITQLLDEEEEGFLGDAMKKLAITWKEFALEQRQSGSAGNAIRTPETMQYMRNTKILTEAAGDVTRVLLAMQLMDARELEKALREIAGFQVQIGDVATARMTFTKAIEMMPHIWDEERAQALQEIVMAQVRAGDATGVIDATGIIKLVQFKDEYQRSDALKEIAVAQVKIGLFDDALRTTDLILLNRNKHLSDLADAFVEKGDTIHFKRLLLPCSYCLDAAYCMCGLLAKLYPEQAKEIVEIVISHEGIKGELDVN